MLVTLSSLPLAPWFTDNTVRDQNKRFYGLLFLLPLKLGPSTSMGWAIRVHGPSKLSCVRRIWTYSAFPRPTIDQMCHKLGLSLVSMMCIDRSEVLVRKGEGGFQFTSRRPSEPIILLLWFRLKVFISQTSVNGYYNKKK